MDVFDIAIAIAKSIEFVEGRCDRIAAEVLAGDFLLAEQLCLGALKFFFGQTFGTQGGHFDEHFFFDQIELLRCGAGVECEISGLKTEKILRTDVISKAEFFTNAHEQA